MPKPQGTRPQDDSTRRTFLVMAFVGVCWVLFGLLNGFHLHCWKNLALTLALTALLFAVGRPLARKIGASSVPTRRDFRNPQLGNRTERRQRARRHK